MTIDPVARLDRPEEIGMLDELGAAVGNARVGDQQRDVVAGALRVLGLGGVEGRDLLVEHQARGCSLQRRLAHTALRGIGHERGEEGVDLGDALDRRLRHVGTRSRVGRARGLCEPARLASSAQKR